MRGHIRKRGSKWAVVIDIGTDPDTGKRKQKWLSGFKTKKEAERASADFIAKYESGQYADSQNMAVKTYLNMWLEDYAAVNVAPKTLSSYRETIQRNLIPGIGEIKLDKLRASHIQGYLSKLQRETKLSTTTIRYYYVILNNALNTAVKWQMLAINPCQGVTPPRKNKKEITPLNAEQASYLLQESENTPLYVPILLALTCGLRRGEVLALKWEQVDFEQSTLHVVKNRVQVDGKVYDASPKTDKSLRSVAMLETTIRILRTVKKQQAENKLLLGPHYNNEGYIVCWEDGRPYRPDYVTKATPKLVGKLGLPEITYHDLRHTHATLLLLKGVHPKIVQERLGHANIAVTLDTYSHVLPSMQEEAAKKLDSVFTV